MNSYKLFLSIILFITLSIVSPSEIFGQILFSDDFEDGSVSDWSVPRNTCSSTWQVVNNSYGIIIPSPCVTETIPTTIIASNTNYSFEVDMTMKQNVNMDRNFVFKYKDESNWYGIHTVGLSLLLHKVVDGTEYFLDNWSNSYSFNTDETYHFKVDILNNKFRIYVNNDLLTTVTDQPPYFDHKYFGLQASSGGISTSEVWFDNVLVTQLPPEDTPTATPTLSPTPSPTASPTESPSPSPTLKSLSVPDLKQFSLPWKNNKYDHISGTIEQYGCALTSATMILNYWGHSVNPAQLNTWLKNQSDGYIRNGLINWLAVTRYSLSNSNLLKPALEYRRVEATDENIYNELNNDRPSIIKVPGHFVVVNGKIDSSFSINDPGYNNRPSLAVYPQRLALNSFSATHTDLSYLMFVTDEDVTLNLFNSLNVLLPTQTFLEEPIDNLLDNSRKSGKTSKVMLFEKPEEGKFLLKVTGPHGPYKLDSYLYDSLGKVTKQNFSGYLYGNDEDKYNISYSGNNSVQSKGKLKTFIKFIISKYTK